MEEQWNVRAAFAHRQGLARGKTVDVSLSSTAWLASGKLSSRLPLLGRDSDATLLSTQNDHHGDTVVHSINIRASATLTQISQCDTVELLSCMSGGSCWAKWRRSKPLDRLADPGEFCDGKVL
jgi:hypothetical protein